MRSNPDATYVMNNKGGGLFHVFKRAMKAIFKKYVDRMSSEKTTNFPFLLNYKLIQTDLYMYTLDTWQLA